MSTAWSTPDYFATTSLTSRHPLGAQRQDQFHIIRRISRAGARARATPCRPTKTGSHALDSSLEQSPVAGWLTVLREELAGNSERI